MIDHTRIAQEMATSLRVCLALVVVSGCAFAAEQLQSRRLLSGKVTMLIPAGFNFLSDAVKREKYPGANAPSYVLSNWDGTVNIAFDHKQIAMKPEDVRQLEDPMRAQFTGAKINSGGIRKLNGTEFLVFNVDSPGPDGEIRNVMAFTSLENQLLVISYNCLPSRDEKCGELGARLIDSIVLSSKPATK